MTDPADPNRPTEPIAPSAAPAPSAGAPLTASPFGARPAPLGGDAVTPVPGRRRSTTSTLVNVLLGVALVVAVGGVAFAAGRATAPAATTGRNGFGNGQFGGNGQAFGPGASGAPDRGGFGGFGGGGGGVSIQGTVTAVAADSITLQLASGQTVTIPLDASTTYHSRTAATAADVANGASVIIQLAGGGRGLGTGNGNGNGNGNGQPGQGPTGSGAPGRALGAASSVTIVPAGS
jgi:hypothetical protein